MRGVHQTRKAVVGINVDRGHQVEPQESEVSKVVLRQAFAAEMRVHATQAAKAIDRHTYAFEVRQLNPTIVANHDVFNVAAAIDERADLSSSFV